MSGFLARASLYLMAALAVPTFLILVSWNALPGSSLYSLKRGLEAGPRLALGNTPLAADYEVALADRRFAEAQALIKSDNALGLSQLQDSIAQATQKIEQTQNAQAKRQLVSNLLAYNQQLETQKLTLTGGQSGTIAQAPTLTQRSSTAALITGTTTQPTAQPTTTITTTTTQTQNPPPSQNNTQVTVTAQTTTTVQAITQTQQQIQQTIIQLEQEDSDNNMPDNNPKKKNDNREKRDNKKRD